ncbi:uncharacterized protein C8R40DRAFT_239312 [Lentinula edodes]|uniref:uncharacterized protein n=1 Tax=Lentinula edodes TaxID=5353 RepID=UPI001E8D98D6|nr:uncharacterized protein C8R40DRAFT_239312 [Lentinula edodes]KAH7874985.1 hypothetical protein C8R40DRAFT_239312 [Lentinula edodes]
MCPKENLQVLGKPLSRDLQLMIYTVYIILHRHMVTIPTVRCNKHCTGAVRRCLKQTRKLGPDLTVNYSGSCLKFLIQCAFMLSVLLTDDLPYRHPLLKGLLRNSPTYLRSLGSLLIGVTVIGVWYTFSWVIFLCLPIIMVLATRGKVSPDTIISAVHDVQTANTVA